MASFQGANEMSPIPNNDNSARLFDVDWSIARREVSNAEIEPQPYFVTFTCYGTWLHGDARGSVDREHNDWQTPPLEPDEERERQAFSLLKHSPVKLGPRQRQTVCQAIQEVCQHRGWRLHALNKVCQVSGTYNSGTYHSTSSTVRDSLVVPALAGIWAECTWRGRQNFRLKAELRTKWDSRTRHLPFHY